MLKKILNLSQGSKLFIGLLSLVLILKEAVYIFQIYVVADFIQIIYLNSVVFAFQEVGEVLFHIIAFIFCTLFRVLFSSIESFLSSKISSQVKIFVRKKIFSKILLLGPSYSDKFGTAEIVSNSIEGVESLELFFSKFLPQLFYSLLIPFILFGLALKINYIVAFFLLASVPVIPISMVFISKWAKKSMGNYWSGYEKLSSTFLDNLQGIVTLKLFNRSEKRLDNMRKDAWNFRNLTMNLLKMQLVSITIMDTFVYGFAGISILLIVISLYKNVILLNGAIVLLLMSIEFFLPIRKLGSLFHAGVNGIQAGRRISDFLILEEPCKDFDGFYSLSSYDIYFDSVSFSYDNRHRVFGNCSYNFQVGNVYGIMGSSGSGKSTLANLLLKFYKISEGSIKIGGVSIYDISQLDLFRIMTFVGSESTIFDGTIRENLQKVGVNIGNKDMIDACRKVGLNIEGGLGLDKPVGEHGSMLSGGERQKLAIVRALLIDPKIFIFDEITASVDYENEQIIRDTIFNLPKDKIVLIISHRKELLEGADVLLTVNDGRLVESSSSLPLLDKKELYCY